MISKLIRLGRDAELKTTQTGKQVLSFAGAYDIGFGDNKKTMWLDCSMWGDRGVKVAQHFTKGTQIVIYGRDLELETYTKGDGSFGAKMKCTVSDFDFAGSSQPQSTPYQNAPTPAPQQAPTQQPQQQQPPAGSDEFDDIPF